MMNIPPRFARIVVCDTRVKSELNRSMLDAVVQKIAEHKNSIRVSHVKTLDKSIVFLFI